MKRSTVEHLNFMHTVVRQQNSGAVGDFILPYSAVYLRSQKWKNYWNRSTFVKVIVKIKVPPFMAHSVLLSCFLAEAFSVIYFIGLIASYILPILKVFFLILFSYIAAISWW